MTSEVMDDAPAVRTLEVESEDPMKLIWLFPALASLVFLVFSVAVASAEGPFGFLTEHARTGWGAQILIDLVNSAVLALCFAAPLARRHGIRLWPWVVLTLGTGSIALLALAARVLYVRYGSTARLASSDAVRAAGHTA